MASVAARYFICGTPAEVGRFTFVSRLLLGRAWIASSCAMQFGRGIVDKPRLKGNSGPVSNEVLKPTEPFVGKLDFSDPQTELVADLDGFTLGDR